MARSPLFDRVTYALKLAAHLEATHTPTIEGLERMVEAQWTRRRFLRTAAATTASAAIGLSLLEHPALGAGGPEIVVVGAGAAGLTCAYRLQQQGLNPRVIEASARLGGRMFTLRNHFPDNQIAELGGEFIDSTHKSLLGLARELGLPIADLAVVNEKGKHSFYFDNQFIGGDADLIDAFRPVAVQVRKDLATLTGDTVTYFHPNNGQKLDRLSVAEWLETRDVKGLIRKVLEAAYVGEYGLELDRQSALNFLFQIAPTTSGKFELFGESDERLHIAEGNDMIHSRIAQRLRRPVELNTRLEAISGRGRGYLLTVSQDGSRKEIRADAVVLAIPFTTLRQVELQVPLPAVKRLSINTLGYGTNAKLLCGFSKRVWQEARSTGYTFTDLGYQSTWETSRKQPGTHAIMTNFTGGNLGATLNQGTLGDRAKEFVNQFDKVYPGAARAYTGQAVRQHWPTYPGALGSYTCTMPGQYTSIGGVAQVPVGNLFFAGEHTSVEFTGFMNGAFESGERAAREVVRRLHRRKRRQANRG